MNCIIIEDQPPAQRILKKFIEDYGNLTLLGTFSNALDALEFLKTTKVDVIFLDIHLPKISGIEFIKALSHPPHVILTTAFSEYALESYELDVVDYLLKPFSFQRFVKAVSKISNENGLSDNHNPIQSDLFIKSGYEYIKVCIQDILYIKSDADYTELFLPVKKHLSSESLKFWEEELDANQFIRIHKSYILNTAKIQKIVSNQVYLDGKQKIPIGRAYKDAFIERFVK